MVSFQSITIITFKVDRSVTGLVAQQQCVGPLHTPVADVAVTALTYFDTVGSATAIGEQPIKGLVDPACGARMAVGEALTNLVFARISDLKVRKRILVIFSLCFGCCYCRVITQCCSGERVITKTLIVQCSCGGDWVMVSQLLYG